MGELQIRQLREVAAAQGAALIRECMAIPTIQGFRVQNFALRMYISIAI